MLKSGERIHPVSSRGEELRQEILDTLPSLHFITLDIGKFYYLVMFCDNVSSMSVYKLVWQ